MRTYHVKRNSEDELGTNYRFERGGPVGAIAFNTYFEDLVAATPADASGPHLAAVLLHLSQLDEWPRDNADIIADELPTFPAIKVAFGFREHAREIINGRR